jgi:hypothetical protein
MNARGQEETNGKLGELCVNCHAPMAVQEGATADGLDIDAVPKHLQGVTCYFCHNVERVLGTHNNPLVLANDVTMRGGLSKPAAELRAVPSAHRVQRPRCGRSERWQASAAPLAHVSGGRRRAHRISGARSAARSSAAISRHQPAIRDLRVPLRRSERRPGKLGSGPQFSERREPGPPRLGRNSLIRSRRQSAIRVRRAARWYTGRRRCVRD